ncbi:unnamed protein product, partial [Ectocarpus sp. 13 AM-2016]
VVSADEVTGEAFIGGGGGSGGGAARPGPMTRENSRESTAARIFKSAPARPPPSTAGAASGAPVSSRGDSGYQTWGSERSSRQGSGGSTCAEENNKGQVQWVVSSAQPQPQPQQQQGAAGAKTSSTWGLPQLQEGPAY